MKSICVLDEILSANPRGVRKSLILDHLGVSDHQLSVLVKALREVHHRQVLSSGRELRYMKSPKFPLWLEALPGIVRLSRTTTKLLVEDACINTKVLTLSTRDGENLRLLPFGIGPRELVTAAEFLDGNDARLRSLRLDSIDSISSIDKFQGGDVLLLRRSLGI